MQYLYNVHQAAAFWVNWRAPADSLEDARKLSSLINHRMTILIQAIECGDLPVRSEDDQRVKHADLREWMTKP